MKISLLLSLQNGLREWVFFKEVSKSNEIVFYWLFAQFSFFVSLILGCLLLATAPWGGGTHIFVGFFNYDFITILTFFLLAFFLHHSRFNFFFWKVEFKPEVNHVFQKVKTFLWLGRGRGGGHICEFSTFKDQCPKLFVY